MGQWLPSISILLSLGGNEKKGGTPAKVGEQRREEFPDAYSEWLVGEYVHGHGQAVISVEGFPPGRD